MRHKCFTSGRKFRLSGNRQPFFLVNSGTGAVQQRSAMGTFTAEKVDVKFFTLQNPSSAGRPLANQEEIH
ncbi:MAG TPA: hypothetical protein DCZ61_07870 [Lachnospiraceae bacterium]|nr:hypothetical protein [Lachnospiraceae bacterium]